MIRRLIASCMLTACAAGVAFAAHPATFILRNGDRVSGELTYKGGTSYTLNGQDYASDNIALIEFVPGDPPAAELSQIPTVDNNPSEHERHVFVTRSGEVIFGKIYSISPDGNSITYDRREGGRQDISTDQLARVYVNPAGARQVYNNVMRAASPVATSGVVPGGISVNANQPWTDTGLTVNKGERISFISSGTIQIAPGTNQSAPGANPRGRSRRGADQGDALTATPDGSAAANVSRANYPVPAMATGGLIGRVGNGAAFPIGSNQQPITMPAAGRLYLGINDDIVADNSGAFSVSVRR
jgi:hypothetical protein